MPSKDHYTRVAKELSKFLNENRLAFKTYRISELDQMIKDVAGDGARVSTDGAAEEFESVMLQRGLLCFPRIQDAEDGYVRVYRAGSLVANLLQAFMYPGQASDADLATLLRTLRSRRATESSESEATETP